MRDPERDAVEIIPGSTMGIVLTCEHAGNSLPSPWAWPEADARLADTHWAWDPGAAELTRELAAALNAPAVLARFTRLLADPNRAPHDITLFRELADGLPVQLNANIPADERTERLRWHAAYHAAVDAMCTAHADRLLLSIHTFTPLYEGQPREVEVAVLFDEDVEPIAVDLAVALHDRGLPTWMNEPWSGKDGLIWSAQTHARRHGLVPLEIEVRNDLASDPAWRAEAVPMLVDALLAWLSDDVHGELATMEPLVPDAAAD